MSFFLLVQDEDQLGQLRKLDNDTQEVVREMRQKVYETKSSLSSNRSRGKVLDALMQQKKTGRIPGILGRLVKNSFINIQTQHKSRTDRVAVKFILFFTPK